MFRNMYMRMLTSTMLSPPTGCPELTICAGSHGVESRKETLWFPKWTLRQDPSKPHHLAEDDEWSGSAPQRESWSPRLCIPTGAAHSLLRVFVHLTG